MFLIFYLDCPQLLRCIDWMEKDPVTGHWRGRCRGVHGRGEGSCRCLRAMGTFAALLDLFIRLSALEVVVSNSGCGERADSKGVAVASSEQRSSVQNWRRTQYWCPKHVVG